MTRQNSKRQKQHNKPAPESSLRRETRSSAAAGYKDSSGQANKTVKGKQNATTGQNSDQQQANSMDIDQTQAQETTVPPLSDLQNQVAENETSPSETAPPDANGSSSNTNQTAQTTTADNRTNQQPPIPEELYEKIPKRTPFRAVALMESIKGKSPEARKREITRIFGNQAGYSGRGLIVLHHKTYMLIYFDSHELMTAAINQDLPTNEENVTYRFVPYEEVKQPRTQEQILQEKQRTIQVIDIPLDIKGYEVRAAFETFGEITKLDMQTRGIYQHAFIIFKDLDTVGTFQNLWSGFVLKHSVRILPLNLDQNQRNHRRKFNLKLAGFKSGTTARDLVHIIEDVKAKSFHIPRHKNTYKLLNYAFLAFDSEADQLAAAQKYYEFDGQKLHWGAPNMKTCHYCGNPNHIAVNCDALKERNKKRDPNLQCLYNKYKPAQHRSRPRS